jgi:hypothetical protein
MGSPNIRKLLPEEITQIVGGVYSLTVPYACYILISPDGEENRPFSLTRLMSDSEKETIKKAIYQLEKSGYAHQTCYVPL